MIFHAKHRWSNSLNRVVCFCLILVVAGCELKEQENRIGKEKASYELVEEYLVRNNLSLKNARYSDEPPGKLKKVAVKSEGGKTHNIYLHYDSGLFDIERKWSQETVKKAMISKIEVEGQE